MHVFFTKKGIRARDTEWYKNIYPDLATLIEDIQSANLERFGREKGFNRLSAVMSPDAPRTLDYVGFMIYDIMLHEDVINTIHEMCMCSLQNKYQLREVCFSLASHSSSFSSQLIFLL